MTGVTPRVGPASRAVVWAGLVAVVLGWNACAGRDLNWDLFNYHVYAGFSVLHDRFDQDFFAAFPAYYNPYALVPFYLLTRTDLSAFAIASVLASAHAVLVCFVYELGLKLIRGVSSRDRQALALIAALLALLNPVYLLEVGTSFTDVTTAVLVVGSWLALATAATGQRRWLVLIAGLAMGAATGLKLSNAIFAIATVAALPWFAATAVARLGLLTSFGAGCAAGFLIAAGPWAWRLYLEFGNPLFPMFNGLFRSPDFVTFGGALDRFLPRSIGDLATLPFRMALPRTMIHVETASPDLRPAALVVVSIIAALAVVYGRLKARRAPPLASASTSLASTPVAPTPLASTSHPSTPLVAGFTVVFLIATALWLLTSGNSRYFLPASALVGLLLVVLVLRLAGVMTRARREGGAPGLAGLVLALGLFTAIQAVQVGIGAAPRFAAAAWTERWIDVSVPTRFRAEPHFYFTIQPQSLSFLAPEVHPESGFFNAAGGFAFDPDGPGGARARALIDRFAGRLRVLVNLDINDGHGRYRVPDLAAVDPILLPWGFVIDREDCDSIGLRDGLPLLDVRLVSASGPTVAGPILNCGLVAAPAGAREAHRRERDQIAAVFDRLEAACPRLFTPRGLQVEGGNGRWYKAYTATDTRATVAAGRVSYFSAVRGGAPVSAGTVSAWIAAPQPIDCDRRAAVAFDGLGH